MNPIESTHWHEAIFAIRAANRYQAHGRIDSAIASERRPGERRWSVGIAAIDPTEQTEWYGSLLTADAAIVSALPGAKWAAHHRQRTGERVRAFVHVTPKYKSSTRSGAVMTAFRTSDAAVRAYVTPRLEPAIRELAIEVLDREEIVIDKSRHAHRAPGAWLRVSGVCADEQAFAQAVFCGIGGDKAFGAGRLITDRSALHAITNEIRQGQVSLA
jgi:hypothetical protein